MDITEELQKAKKRRADIIGRINELDREKQGLIAEALRVDGEVRVLERLSNQEKKG